MPRGYDAYQADRNAENFDILDSSLTNEEGERPGFGRAGGTNRDLHDHE